MIASSLILEVFTLSAPHHPSRLPAKGGKTVSDATKNLAFLLRRLADLEFAFIN
ncbi:hypothetical protein [Synechococcus sp. UW179A]|uniref:hypothetical protein n=1 Tax=Synechococcus sp. UW179A TaxID=2575510 RepID=UPI001A7E0A6E|nr:hypothetical protein [Synechococcus sp. UW179A]